LIAVKIPGESGKLKQYPSVTCCATVPQTNKCSNTYKTFREVRFAKMPLGSDVMALVLRFLHSQTSTRNPQLTATTWIKAINSK
jgi:hypothetical protein